MMAEAGLDISTETYNEGYESLKSPNPDVGDKRRESWDGEARRELCEDILRERYLEDKEIVRMKLGHEMRLNEMKLEEERENRRLNESRLEHEMRLNERKLEEERENRKLRLMELEERRRRNERAEQEQELNLTMQSIESHR